jgi:hypothetical protein
MNKHFSIILLFLCVITGGCVKESDDSQVMIRKNVDWREISSCFKPPAQYENVFGDYRSPLVFANPTC